MPELPEVETIVRRLAPRLESRCIVGFESRWPRQVSPSVNVVRRNICGRRVVRLRRRAKFIVAELERPGFRGQLVGLLWIHLRMSGRMECGRDHAEEPPHVRAVWRLDDGERVYLCDARKFGRIVYSRDAAGMETRLGAEPLDHAFTVGALAGILRRRRRRLKPLLLDQSLIAGLGNIYTDEALHRARLHPLAISDRLDEAEVRRLHEAIRAVLRAGIRHNGTTIDWIYPEGRMQNHLAAYGRAGLPCRRCGEAIVALRVGQRGTHICPTCQPPPRAVR